MGDYSCRETVIPDYRSAVAQNETAGRAGRVIPERFPLQPLIQRCFAALETGQLTITGDRLGWVRAVTSPGRLRL